MVPGPFLIPFRVKPWSLPKVVFWDILHSACPGRPGAGDLTPGGVMGQSAARRVLVLLCCGIVATLSSIDHARAASPVGIVEEASNTNTGVAAFDYLRKGERIVVPEGTMITLGYFASCTREVIMGGTVTIGTNQSEVSGGTISRQVLKCPEPIDLDHVVVATTAAVPKLMFRGERKGRPAVVIFYTAPVIALKNPGEVIVERVDREETPRVFSVEGPFLDLAKQQVFLSAGGIYRLTAGGREMLFQVSVEAFEGGGPLLARLLRM